jgi:CubicO group peptidase (beta-lactamase class C family)
MTQTDIRTREEKMKLGNMAWGHMYDSSKGRYVQADSFPAANYTVWLGNRKGPGRISSTSRDLLAWDQDLYSDRLVSAATLKEAFSPATLSNGTLSQYGFGWELSSDTVLGNYVHHSGDNPGYQTYLIRYIEKNMTVIVLSNHANPAFHKLISAIQNTLTTLPGQ